MTEHILKCWPSQFNAVRAGVKPFEFRKNDRDFKVGDTLVLREFIPPDDTPFGEQGEPGRYTGAMEWREVTYVLSSGFGVPDGFAVLGLKVPDHRIHTLTFVYRNWRGEIGTRKVRPMRIEFAATEWHPERQWLLIAWDEDKASERSFAIKDINPQHGELASLVTDLFNVLDVVEWLPEEATDLMTRIDAVMPGDDAASSPPNGA